jgi:coupling of ubiquitin conjugation to ER degradation protein 1
VTFQPPPPPPSTASSATAAQTSKTAEKPAQPDLITRYNLKDKLATPTKDEEWTPAAPSKDKAWSSNKEERQKLLQKRRDQMVLDARRKMEAKIAAERAQGKTS